MHHIFRSAEKKALEVVYAFILPRDAALRRFEVRGRGFTVAAELKPVKEAVEEYERELAEGHLAAMTRQYRDGLVSLTVGNLRPDEDVAVKLEIAAGVGLRDDGLRFRVPFTIAPSYHSRARAAEVAAGVGEIEMLQDLFGDLLLPQFQTSRKGLQEVAFDLEIDSPWEVQEIASPSHSICVGRSGRVSLAPASDIPDRDLVLDARLRVDGSGILAGKGDDRRTHFAAVIPSSRFGDAEAAPRSVAFLIDRSGSMSGELIMQARKAVAAYSTYADVADGRQAAQSGHVHASCGALHGPCCPHAA